MADTEPAQTGEAQGGEKKKNKKNKNAMTYGTYLHSIVKNKAPNHKIAAKSMYVLNAIVLDLQKRLRDESVNLAKFNKKSTLSAAHVQTATKILFTGEISSNAVSEGTAAVSKYEEATEKPEKTD